MYKKMLSGILAVSMLLSVVVINKSAALQSNSLVPQSQNTMQMNLSNDGRHVDVGYIMRENFFTTTDLIGTPGWTRVNLDTKNITNFITDQSKTNASYMFNKFIPQTDGVFTAEFRIIPTSVTNGGEIRFRNGDNDCVTISIDNNILYYNNADHSRANLGSLDYAQWTGIKLVFHMDTKKISIMINGVTKIDTPVGFSVAQDTIDNIYFGISAAGTGAYSVGYAYIYKGYAVYEDLISASVTYDTVNQPNTNFNLKQSITTHSQTGADFNKADTPLVVDGNDSTFWAAPEDANPSGNSLLIDYKGVIHKINRIVLKAPTASVNVGLIFSYLNASDQWVSVTQTWSSPMILGTTAAPTVINLPTTYYCKQINMVFYDSKYGSGSTQTTPKISEFEAYYVPSGSDTATSLHVPDDWDCLKNGGDVEVSATAPFRAGQEYNSFKLTASDATSDVQISKTMSLTGSITEEYNFIVNGPARKDGVSAVLKQDNGNIIKIFTQGNDIKADITGTQQQTLVSNYCANKWYRVWVIYKADMDKISIDVDGYTRVKELAVSSTFSEGIFNHFSAAIANGMTGSFNIDDIRIGPFVQREVVPKPEPLDTGNLIISTQSCNIWRQGSQLGWGINDNPAHNDRKPVLGWYDEGDPVVADWETKYMVEHGIKSENFCWYRGDAGPVPVEECIASDELYNGYLKSQYRDMLKFTIMLTNGGCKVYSYDDFKNNLVNYWIETFFKNPSYLKTSDNKPVFYVYNSSNLISSVGDVNNDGKADYKDGKIALDYLRNACIDAGFGGCYIVCEQRNTSSSILKQISNCGFDSIFAYCFGLAVDSSNTSNTDAVTNVENILKSQRQILKGTNVGIIPTLSKMMDSSPWFDTGYIYPWATYTLDLAHYKERAEWIKNVFDAQKIDPAGNKMMMIDTWNEMTEGHFVFPTYGAETYPGGTKGFGALDVIRDVFGLDYFEHKDILPLEEGYGPYDKWYPNGWNEPTDPGHDYKSDTLSLIQRVDNILGYNSPGGTSFIQSNAYTTPVENTFTINRPDSMRVNIDADLVKRLKEARASLDVTTANGKITIPNTIIKNLDSLKSFDVVFSMLIDVSQVKDAIAAKGYSMYANKAYTVRLLQSGSLVEYTEPITVSMALNMGCRIVSVEGTTVENIDSIVQNDSDLKFILTKAANIVIVNK